MSVIILIGAVVCFAVAFFTLSDRPLGLRRCGRHHNAAPIVYHYKCWCGEIFKTTATPDRAICPDEHVFGDLISCTGSNEAELLSDAEV